MKRKLSIIISVIVVIGIILGITLGLIRKNIFNQNVGFNISGLDAYIIYSKGTDILTGTLDTVTNYSDTAMSTEITLYKNTSKTIYGHIYLDLTTISSTLAAEPALKWVITSNNTILNQGDFTNYSQTDSIPLKLNIPLSTTEQKFQIYVWLDDSMDINDEIEGLTLSTSVRAEASEKGYSSVPAFIKNSNAPLDSVNSTYVTGYYESYTMSSQDETTLKAFIMNDGMSSSEADLCIANEVEDWVGCLDDYLDQYNEANDPDIVLTGVGNPIPGINFKQNASDTNGKGLYIRSGTENNINPIYYYRGAVDNNNVYFANYCWKIVRTTETGGLKLAYNGAPTSGSCGTGTTSQTNATIGNSAFNTNRNDAKYVGYTYDNSGVETDSTIKTAIDTWYQTNILTNFDNYIEDTVYCNDREEATSSERTQIATLWDYTFSASDKLYKSTARYSITGIPSLECTNNADKYTKSSSIGNGKLTYPVGLLTSDEIWISGMRRSGLNNYLNNNDDWWSLSPHDFSGGYAIVWYVHYVSGLANCRVDHDRLGARPALSLKPGQNFEYGNGSGNNPYRFVATVPIN